MLELLRKNKIESLIIFFVILAIVLTFVLFFQDYNFLRQNKLQKYGLQPNCNYKPELMRTKYGKKYGYVCSINTGGVKDFVYYIAIPPIFDYAMPFTGDYAVVGKTSRHLDRPKVGVIDKFGTSIIPLRFFSVSNFDGRTGIGCVGDTTYTSFCGIIDNNGDFIVSPTYPYNNRSALIERKKEFN